MWRRIAVLSVVVGVLCFGSVGFAAPQVLEVSPTFLGFSASAGGANPASQVLSIWNSGHGPMDWEVTETCSWLVIEPNIGSSSGEVDDVNLSVDISGLTEGSYNCQFTVTGDGAANSPQIVDVNLIVIGPIIELSATRFKFSFPDEGGNPPDQILNISNSSVSTLNWTIDYDCGWLDVYPTSGSSTGDVNEVVLSVDINGLGPNDYYTCDLTVSDPNAENNPQIITVVLSNIITVKADGTGDYPTIQAAITAATTGDTIILLPGTYTGTGNKDLDFGGKAITVRSTDPYDPVVVAATVIDCQNAGRGFYFHSGEDANSIVAGLTVKNGRITGTPINFDAYGGGIYCSDASPTIANCSILNNSAYGWDCTHCGGQSAGYAYGGGISCISNSHPAIINCDISGNLARAPYTIEGWAIAYGGGIYCSSDSTVAIYDSRITSNIAHGGKWMSDASWISYGLPSFGGGVYINGSSTIKNCVIANNETVVVFGEDYEGPNCGASQGAGIYSNGNVTIKNCSICNNDTDPTDTGFLGEGGGIYGAATVKDSIIWANLATNQIQGSASVTYSDVQGGYAGVGNINADPCFVTGPEGDYYLSQIAAGQASDSPCVNMGSDTAVNLRMDIFTTRTDKVWDEGIVDMGYHYPMPNPADIDGDGYIDFVDFAILASQWRQAPGVPSADIAPPSGDGIVDIYDVGLLFDYWLW